MGKLTNIFSWSMSRSEKFRTCRRAYYFHYYGSWNGWDRNASPKTRKLWILKKLTTRKAWAGSSVHEAIAWTLDQTDGQGLMPPAEDAIKRMQERMRSEFRDSRSGAWKFKKSTGLQEHEYEEHIDDIEWLDNWEHARKCLKNFYESPIREEISSVPREKWFPIDSLDSFNLNGITFYVAPDFAFIDAGQNLRILDWKTGREKESDKRQVMGYVLYAMSKWNSESDNIRPELHYLGEPYVSEVAINEELLDVFRKEAENSINEMQSLLTDPVSNYAEEKNFTPSPEKRKCRRCNFRGACPDALIS